MDKAIAMAESKPILSQRLHWAFWAGGDFCTRAVWAAWLFSRGTYPASLLGATVSLAASILDGIDLELAGQELQAKVRVTAHGNGYAVAFIFGRDLLQAFIDRLRVSLAYNALLGQHGHMRPASRDILAPERLVERD